MKCALVIFVNFFLVVSLQAAVIPDRYTLFDLGTLPDYSFASYACGINNGGQVVGYSGVPNGYHPFLWSDGSMSDLKSLPGHLNSCATGISDYGQVVGYCTSSYHAILWSGGIVSNLETLGASDSRANAINASGQVVGWSYSSGWAHAFLWNGGPVTDLGTLGGASSFANDINDYGQVVGAAYNAKAQMHACLWNSGNIMDLGMYADDTQSEATAINVSGQAVGYSFSSGSPKHAVLWSAGTTTYLGSLATNYPKNSSAYDINASGQVVGESETSNPGETHAFLWSGGGMIDLNSLIPTGSQMSLTSARGINDLGQIVGSGQVNGTTHAYLLTPVPEPSTLALLGMCGIGLIAWVWRRRKA